MKVENVMQSHPNTNMNLLARTKYVHDNYPPAKNPLLYGADAHRALHQHHAELHAGAHGDSRLVRQADARADQDGARASAISRFSRPRAPVPGPGEALVRIGPSGLCGTDLLLYDGVYRGRNRPVPSPLIVGHEASGEVVDARTGHQLAGAGHARRHRGGDRLRSLLSLPARQLQPVPGLASHRADARRCARRVRRRAGGLAAAAAGRGHARERGVSRTARDGGAHAGARQARARRPRRRSSVRAARVPASAGAAGRRRRTDRDVWPAGDEARLELAASLGADDVCRRSSGDRGARASTRPSGIGFGLSIESGGTSSAIQTALDIVAGNGTLVSLGIVRPTEIDVLQVMRKDLTWIGVVASVRRHFADAIGLIHTGKVRPARVDYASVAAGRARSRASTPCASARP